MIYTESAGEIFFFMFMFGFLISCHSKVRRKRTMENMPLTLAFMLQKITRAIKNICFYI